MKGTVPLGEMVCGALRRVTWATFLAAVLERALRAILAYERGRHNLKRMCTTYNIAQRKLHIFTTGIGMAMGFSFDCES